MIMAVLRMLAGPIVHWLSPLGMLAICSLLAIAGLLMLSQAAGIMILLAATIYGIGKSFFWPTMLGVVAERFPRGGALTLNCIGGVGMLGLSVGGVFLGNIQDRAIEQNLLAHDRANQTALHETYLTEPRRSVLGEYRALDTDSLAAAPAPAQQTVETIQAQAKQGALKTAAIFPAIMLICYIGLILYFRSRGGYRADVLTRHAAEDEEFTGGVTGPADL
jgi:hypothetical protein